MGTTRAVSKLVLAGTISTCSESEHKIQATITIYDGNLMLTNVDHLVTATDLSY